MVDDDHGGDDSEHDELDAIARRFAAKTGSSEPAAAPSFTTLAKHSPLSLVDQAVAEAKASSADEQNKDIPLSEDEVKERCRILKVALERFQEAGPNRLKKTEMIMLGRGKQLLMFNYGKWSDHQNIGVIDSTSFDAEGTADIDEVCRLYSEKVPRDKYGFDLVVSEFTLISQRSYRIYQNARESKLKRIFRRHLQRLDETQGNVSRRTIDAVINSAVRSRVISEEESAVHFGPWLNQMPEETVTENEFVTMGNRVLPLDYSSFVGLAGKLEEAAKALEKDEKQSTTMGARKVIEPPDRQAGGPCRGCSGCASSRDKCVIA